MGSVFHSNCCLSATPADCKCGGDDRMDPSKRSDIECSTTVLLLFSVMGFTLTETSKGRVEKGHGSFIELPQIVHTDTGCPVQNTARSLRVIPGWERITPSLSGLSLRSKASATLGTENGDTEENAGAPQGPVRDGGAALPTGGASLSEALRITAVGAVRMHAMT